MRKRVIIIFVLIILLSGTVWMIIGPDRKIIVDIKLEDVHHIIANTGSGPIRLDSNDSQDGIDSLIKVINGEYRLDSIWSSYGKSGGGPYQIVFYDSIGEAVYVIRYLGKYLAIPSGNKVKYYLYEKIGGKFALDAFEDYLSKYGKLQL